MTEDETTNGPTVIPTNVIPDKLLRIFLSEKCNYRCTFCGWDDPSQVRATPDPIRPEDLSCITEGMVRCGCRNFQLTGGEPLLQPRSYVCDVVSSIASVPGVNQFWIVTNGSMLRDRLFCKELYNAGLRRVNISIAGETNEKYRKYSRSGVSLDSAPGAIENATQSGLAVHVHTCLNRNAVSSFEELQVLLRAAQAKGARHAFYFGLFSTPAILQTYNRLKVDTQAVTEGFFQSAEWELRHNNSGRSYFSNGTMRVFVPRKRAFIVTDTCKKNDCGEHCQGIYAAQLIHEPYGLAVRACQRIFDDSRNLFRIDTQLLRIRDIDGLASVFKSVWVYAYGK